MSKIKTVFMGTPDFAVPSLRVLFEKTEVLAVVTQPDRPKGRGKKVQFSPVKEKALEYGLQVYQPERVKDSEFVAILKELRPELIVVVAFGQILSQEILDIPRLGCVNVHGSLLPQYRGAAPIHWAIINGEVETGITTMLMDKGLDTGDMLLKDSIAIPEDMTTEDAHDILMEKGASLLASTIDGLVAGTIVPEKQWEEMSSYASMLDKELAHIKWHKSAVEINNLIRGLNSWPVAWTLLGEKNFRIWKGRVIARQSKGEIGEVVELSKGGFGIQTGDGILEVLEIQPPGKKRMNAGDFVRGNGIQLGEIFV